MNANRRTFVKTLGLSLANLSWVGETQPPKPDGTPRLLVNHLGFLPNAGKYLVVAKPPATEFTVQRITNSGKTVRTTVHQAPLKQTGGDLGSAWVGNFSAVREEGIYRLVCGDLESRHVIVYRDIYRYPLHVLYNYFPTQRCGESLTGYNAPCHLRDARRVDNHEFVDVTGGWHQSCDLRKWMLGTPFGLLGLAQLGSRSPRWDEGQIDKELRWGNQYFLKMMRPDGGLMDHVVLPLGWNGERDLYPNDAPLPVFYLTIVGEAMAAAYYRERDSRYYRTCVDAATKLWKYVNGPNGPKSYAPPVIPPYHGFLKNWFAQYYPGASLTVGDSLFAAVWLHKATGERKSLEAACRDATVLVDLQIGGDVAKDPLAACFRESPSKQALALSTYYGFFGPLGLCELIELEPRHPDRGRWLEALQRVADQYYLMSDKNPWGLIPSYWYSSDPGQGRPAGSGYYKYFYNNFGLRIGVNHDILGKALFLLRAYRIRKDRRYLDVAGRQIDWVLGCNPFDMSTVEGIGYNQPERLISAEFFPPTPQIPGAVMSGVIGSMEDEPVDAGSVLSEYDVPPTSLLIWLLAEMQEYLGQG